MTKKIVNILLLFFIFYNFLFSDDIISIYYKSDNNITIKYVSETNSKKIISKQMKKSEINGYQNIILDIKAEIIEASFEGGELGSDEYQYLIDFNLEKNYTIEDNELLTGKPRIQKINKQIEIERNDTKLPVEDMTSDDVNERLKELKEKYLKNNSLSEINTTETKEIKEIKETKVSVEKKVIEKENFSLKEVLGENKINKKTFIYYNNKSGFVAIPYLHYSINGKWTKLPGIKMEKSIYQDYYKLEIDIKEKDEVQLSFNDNNGNWDSFYGRNYKLDGTSKFYTIYDNKIKSEKPNGEINTKEAHAWIDFPDGSEIIKKEKVITFYLKNLEEASYKIVQSDQYYGNDTPFKKITSGFNLKLEKKYVDIKDKKIKIDLIYKKNGIEKTERYEYNYNVPEDKVKVWSSVESGAKLSKNNGSVTLHIEGAETGKYYLTFAELGIFKSKEFKNGDIVDLSAEYYISGMAVNLGLKTLEGSGFTLYNYIFEDEKPKFKVSIEDGTEIKTENIEIYLGLENTDTGRYRIGINGEFSNISEDFVEGSRIFISNGLNYNDKLTILLMAENKTGKVEKEFNYIYKYKNINPKVWLEPYNKRITEKEVEVTFNFIDVDYLDLYFTVNGVEVMPGIPYKNKEKFIIGIGLEYKDKVLIKLIGKDNEDNILTEENFEFEYLYEKQEPKVWIDKYRKKIEEEERVIVLNSKFVKKSLYILEVNGVIIEKKEYKNGDILKIGKGLKKGDKIVILLQGKHKELEYVTANIMYEFEYSFENKLKKIVLKEDIKKKDIKKEKSEKILNDSKKILSEKLETNKTIKSNKTFSSNEKIDREKVNKTFSLNENIIIHARRSHIWPWFVNDEADSKYTPLWPGNSMENEDEKWYSYIFDKEIYSVFFVLNNNGENKTEDIFIEEKGEYWILRDKVLRNNPN